MQEKSPALSTGCWCLRREDPRAISAELSPDGQRGFESARVGDSLDRGGLLLGSGPDGLQST